jgi:nucleoid-associated protein YgaU
MALQKGSLRNKETGKTVQFNFNPSEFQWDKTVPWGSHPVKGLDSPEAQFTRGGAWRIRMELLFDTYEEKPAGGAAVSVYEKYVTDLMDLVTVVPRLKRPPVCEWMWGKWVAQCLVEDIAVRYTMFADDLTPVRAVVKLNLAEYKTANEQQRQRANPGPADRMKRRTVRQGDTLALLAFKEYDDPRRWRAIAEANNIDNPRVLRPGQQLVIPAIE